MNELREKIIDTLKEGEPKADIADAILDAVIAALPDEDETTDEENMFDQYEMGYRNGGNETLGQIKSILLSAKENKQ